jgi:hypothetical protein
MDGMLGFQCLESSIPSASTLGKEILPTPQTDPMLNAVFRIERHDTHNIEKKGNTCLLNL